MRTQQKNCEFVNLCQGRHTFNGVVCLLCSEVAVKPELNLKHGKDMEYMDIVIITVVSFSSKFFKPYLDTIL